MAGTTKGSLVETSEVLNLAADLIEERGWTQGQGWPGVSSALTGVVYEGTALCLEGGVMAALGVWNDHKGRTATEVIEVLRVCALIEAAREEQDAAWATYADVVSA